MLLLALGGASARAVGTGFLPEMDEGAFVLDYFSCPPARRPLPTPIAAAAEDPKAVLRSLPEVDVYSRRTGAELGPAAATEVNRGDIMVRLKPRAARSAAAEDVIAVARARVAREVPEARVEFVQVLQDILNDLAGTPRPLEIKIFGDDYAVLRGKALEVTHRVEGVPGLVDLYPGFEGDVPELRLRLDAAGAARLGLTSAEVTANLDTALHGTVAALIRRADRPLGVRVRYADAVRFDRDALTHLPLIPATSSAASAAGGPTPSLGAVAAFERASSPSVLLRENLRPTVIVTADHEGSRPRFDGGRRAATGCETSRCLRGTRASSAASIARSRRRSATSRACSASASWACWPSCWRSSGARGSRSSSSPPCRWRSSGALAARWSSRASPSTPPR